MKKLIRLLIIVFVFVNLTACSKMDIKNIYNDNYNINISTWMWNVNNIKQIDSLEYLKKFKINEVYLNTGWSPENKSILFDEKKNDYIYFMRILDSNNIKTQSLLSNNDWTLETNYNDMKNQVLKVLDFNKKYKTKFSAIHLDIEPYSFKDFENKKEFYLKGYLNNLSEIKKELDKYNKDYNDNVILSIDLPFWINQKDFYINNESFLKQVLNNVDEIVIMDYTKNKNDFISRGTDILKEVDNNFDNKKVKIGVEIQQSDNDEIKNVSLSELNEAEIFIYLKDSINEFNKFNCFKGIAIHEFDSLKKIK